MKSTFQRVSRLCAIVVALSLAAACDDGNGSGPSDTGNLASSTNAVVDSVVASFFEENESVNSLSGPVGGIIAGITGQPSITPVGLSAAGDDVWFGRSVAKAREWLLSQARAGHAGAEHDLNIPTSLLGVTCIWDPVDQTYVPDPNDPGNAPTNGIRFRLYELDPSTLFPVQPLQDIGLVDIVDLTTEPNIDVAVSSDVGGVTLLSYDITGTLDVSTFTLSMIGFASNGTDQLDFTWSAAESETGSSFSLTTSAASLDMSFTQTVDATGVINTEITINNLATGNELGIVLGLDESAGTVTPESGVFFNGEEVADFRIGSQGLELVPTGSELDEQDLFELSLMLNVLGDLFVNILQLFSFGVAATGNFAG
ncbi:MAG: hypothetical protein GWN99_16545 [Gemmatimonadetes bacterium]|uniref:Uncharacterized protein n=1 Tax=Candidatus Kutchimonas denitrificans TaxID=3056748 RepID=A0AAE5CCM7_9BACT|nr:hypothetical protein [Gemmatimonadota bacterium]NIR74399.1 hypothetical protein [Candidatus Kutchimonas denitrificans]NIS02650.1 hypothetical protein [Gemmatimonadota bacterium]NIT68525.1 hypothetical protein [Gemmatimonadota bacterium]NIU52002.1 hypothetical protein [Gemmatimonadota bacterium]